MKTLKSKLFKTLFAASILATVPVSSLTVIKEIEPKLEQCCKKSWFFEIFSIFI
jgi:hypothetical protein